MDTVLGPGKPKELFLSDSNVRQQYKAFVATIINRRNSLTGERLRRRGTHSTHQLVTPWLGSCCVPACLPALFTRQA